MFRLPLGTPQTSHNLPLIKVSSVYDANLGQNFVLVFIRALGADGFMYQHTSAYDTRAEVLAISDATLATSRPYRDIFGSHVMDEVYVTAQFCAI